MAESPEPTESRPPSSAEEPVPAVPTSETTPVWAHTVPVQPAEDGAEAAVSGDEALPAMPMQKGDPDWSKTQSSANGEGKKESPAWASTVPTSPGDTIDEPVVEEEVAAPPPADSTEPPTEAPLTRPMKSVAGDAMKSTWPPAAESSAAPPEETDIWPPEPPTERAMPAWPPPSELAGRAPAAVEEEPATPAQAIPSWPDSFEQTAEPTAIPPTITPAPAPTPASAPAPAPAAAAPKPAPRPGPVPAATEPPPAPMPPVISTVPSAPPAAPEPAPPAAHVDPAPPAAPVEPASAAPSRPTWAPGPAAPATHAAPRPAEPKPSLQVPAWAPKVPLAGEPGKPTWFSPQEPIPHATAQPMAQSTPPAAAEPAPAPPIVGGQLPVAPVPAAPKAATTNQSAWEVVEQHGKTDKNAKVAAGPTAEDRSYAEWFAWAKRGGAPASACHGAAQGAFKALSSGKDVMTAVQWATAAMGQPPEPVSFARQQYCAWFSLGNIDLNMDQHRAHMFAGAAVQALDAGMDASAAHAAGLAAAGVH